MSASDKILIMYNDKGTPQGINFWMSEISEEAARAMAKGLEQNGFGPVSLQRQVQKSEAIEL